MAARKSARKNSINTLPLYAALVILFILFIVYQSSPALSVILGIAFFLVIIALIVIEIANGVKEEGVWKNVAEILAAVLIVIAFWYGLKFLLHTNYPLDVVPSCSMLPALRRGDLIVLHGVQDAPQVKAPVISISESAYESFQANISGEFLSCVAYRQNGSTISVSQIVKPGYSVGLLSQRNGGGIVPDSSQQSNLIKYTCGTATVLFSNGTKKSEAYTTAITVNGTTIYNDTNNSIIVYQTVPGDYFYKLGDSYIVHRVYAILDANGKYIVLTKGDNNPGLDLQYGNYPVNVTYVQGRVVLSIPYLGYLKLALSNNFIEPAGCSSTVIGS